MSFFDYKQIFDLSPLPIFIHQEGKLVHMNAKLAEYLGYSEEELKAMNVFDLIHPEDRSWVTKNALLRLADQNVPSFYEFRLARKNGEEAYIKGLYSLVEYRGGPAILVQVIDVTKEKAILKALEESERKFRKLFHNSGDAMVIMGLTEEGVFSGYIEVNAVSCRVTGYSREEFFSMHPFEILSEEARDRIPFLLKEVNTSETITFEAELISKQGTSIPVEINYHLFTLKGQRVILAICRDMAERKKHLNHLKASEARFRAVFESAGVGMALLDLSQECPRVLEQNSALQRMLGYSPEELCDLRILALCCNASRKKTEECIKDQDNTNQNFPKLIKKQKMIVRKDGQPVWVNITYSLIQGFGSGELGLSVVEDITENKNMQEQLFYAHQRLHDIVEFLPDATFAIDLEGKVIFWNQAMEIMTGVVKDEIVGKAHIPYGIAFHGEPRPSLADLVVTGDIQIRDQYDYVKKQEDTYFTEFFSPNLYEGKGAYIWAKASPLYDCDGKLVGAVESLRDISDQKQIEGQLRHLATHDFLTGIPNRYFFEEALKKVVAKAKRGVESSLLMIDIDNFKLINDTKGHGAGDEALIQIARILKTNLRESDMLTRLGGDEFAVLLEGTAIKEAFVVAEKLRVAVDESELHLPTCNAYFNLSISIGLVAITGDIESQKLLSLADNALYIAKDKGRNRVFEAKPWDDASARLTKENKLIIMIKKALKENRFVFLYQPIVNINTEEIIHYEVLTRLLDQEGAWIAPGIFIPVAERYGLMPEIDRWVIINAVRTMEQNPTIKVFVNLSGLSLGDESLLGFIEDIIKESNIEPFRLGFEITETSVVKDLMLAEYWIRRLKQLGCQFALDDFGIGFTSFSYLKLLPVDYLKIDGSFIKSLNKESTNVALVQAMNSVAVALGKKTIAEAVENEEIRKILSGLKVNCAQGYYFGKPAQPKALGLIQNEEI